MRTSVMRPRTTAVSPDRFTEPPGWIPRAIPGVVVEFLIAERVPEVLERGYSVVYVKAHIERTLATIPWDSA